MYDQGVLIVASAGNGGSSDYLYPASFDQVISVGAIDVRKNHASFSQYNDQVELVAPGVQVLSSLAGNRYGPYYHAYHTLFYKIISDFHCLTICML